VRVDVGGVELAVGDDLMQQTVHERDVGAGKRCQMHSGVLGHGGGARVDTDDGAVVGTDAARRRQYLYHQAWQQERAEEKFDRVLEMSERLPAWRTEVRRDLGTRVWAATGCWPRLVITVLGSVTLEVFVPTTDQPRSPERPGKASSSCSVRVKNQRLAAVGYVWAFAALTASPPARALNDRRRAIGDGHVAALRNMFNRFLSQLHHCLATGQKFDP